MHSYPGLVISDCVFEGNEYGIIFDYIDVVNSTFLENTGYAAIWASALRATDSEFIGNGGDAVDTMGGKAVVINTTIVGHSLYGIKGYSQNYPSEATNCIIWNNGTDIVNCPSTYSNISDWNPGTGNISVDPRFANPENSDFHLTFGSPCIDTGTFTNLTEDLEGNPRPLDGNFSGEAKFDMGAYEYVPRYVIQKGDYKGDGRSDIAIFRQDAGLWAVRGLGRVYFGAGGDIPISGDYNGDGYTEIAVFRPSQGLWAIKGYSRLYFDNNIDYPVPADFSGY